MDFIKRSVFLKNLIDEHLKKLVLSKKLVSDFQNVLLYPIECGGKRIRPILCFMTYDFLTQKEHETYPEDVLTLASSLELIHTYSLIHDDLPAMDDDTLRRGKPTTHVQFGEAKAILAGDSLLTMAFNLLSTLKKIDIKTLQIILRYLSEGAGNEGMIGGQVLDIENENKNLSLEEIQSIHQLKTGKMLEASILLPLFYHQKSDELSLAHKQLKIYGKQIGLAFQIVDDVLDLTQSSKTLGKNAKSDLENGKSTYATLLGLEKAMEKAKECIKTAKDSLDSLEGESTPLKLFADYIVERIN